MVIIDILDIILGKLTHTTEAEIYKGYTSFLGPSANGHFSLNQWEIQYFGDVACGRVYT